MGQVWEWITGGIAFLIGSLKAAIGSIAGRVLGTFGLSIISFEAALPALKAFVMQYVNGLPADALNFLGAIGLGQGMSMILSALTFALANKVWVVPTSVANQLPGASQP